MSNQILSDVFAWAMVILPAIVGIVNAILKMPRFAIIAPFVIAIFAGLSLYYRNAVTAEKDLAIESLKPRSLKPDQFTKTALAGTHGTVGFNTVTFEAESRQYAQGIAEAFRSAGWTVAYVAANLTGNVGQPAVAVKTSAQLDQAKLVCEALITAGLGCQGYDANEKWIEGTVSVLIGQKP